MQYLSANGDVAAVEAGRTDQQQAEQPRCATGLGFAFLRFGHQFEERGAAQQVRRSLVTIPGGGNQRACIVQNARNRRSVSH